MTALKQTFIKFENFLLYNSPSEPGNMFYQTQPYNWKGSGSKHTNVFFESAGIISADFNDSLEKTKIFSLLIIPFIFDLVLREYKTSDKDFAK